jgi:hypothetical protein
MNKFINDNNKIFFTLIGGGLLGVIMTVIIPFSKLFTTTNVSSSIKEQVSYELELVKDDLETYGGISARMQNIIINSIKSSSEEYKVPIGLIHAILRVESDYKYWIDHPVIVVNGKQTCAKGIAGIVWEYWKDSLNVNKIAEMESDLYSPEVSIKGCAYILRVILNRVVNSNSSNVLALRLAEGYFGNGTWGGTDATDYKNKLIRYTSDLWMIRMTRILKDTGQFDSNKKDTIVNKDMNKKIDIK